MSEELVAKLRDPNHWSSDDSLAAADLIESQAKELAECQARVIVLSEAASAVYSNEEHAFSGGMRSYKKGSPTWQVYEDLRLALASADTAAQTSGEVHLFIL